MEKLYGPIGNARLLDIEVYENGILKYSGIIEDAPEQIKELMYKSVKLINGKSVYEI